MMQQIRCRCFDIAQRLGKRDRDIFDVRADA